MHAWYCLYRLPCRMLVTKCHQIWLAHPPNLWFFETHFELWVSQCQQVVWRHDTFNLLSNERCCQYHWSLMCINWLYLRNAKRGHGSWHSRHFVRFLWSRVSWIFCCWIWLLFNTLETLFMPEVHRPYVVLS